MFKQKLKHLLYEQQNNIAEIKAENMVSLKVNTEYTHGKHIIGDYVEQHTVTESCVILGGATKAGNYVEQHTVTESCGILGGATNAGDYVEQHAVNESC